MKKDVYKRQTLNRVNNYIANSEKTLVYFPYRSQVDQIYSIVSEKEMRSINRYHGQLHSNERKIIEKNYRNGNTMALLCTKAFGMGVDVSDITHVVHFAPKMCIRDRFCEGGQIRLPNNVTSLYILLEKMVFPVITSKRRGVSKYPSFHPKFWLVRYIDNNGNPLYRVVVLSRNLTFDRSWDVTFCMDGTKKSEETDKNNPVADFLAYLVKQLPAEENAKEKQKKIRAISRLSLIHI